VWPSPAHAGPPDLAARLVANGFREIGRGHLMVLEDPTACPPVGPRDVPLGVELRTIASPADVAGRELEDAALVLAEAFGALPGRSAELTDELRHTLDDPRVVVVLASADGQPAAVAKATTFEGCTYLSSIGTRGRFRGRGLGALVTRRAVEAGLAQGPELTYLGVFSDNEPALRLYGRLGFESVGESPDLLLS
jgi:ribosomal protein S18 acetylase RimI-like enzyme